MLTWARSRRDRLRHSADDARPICCAARMADGAGSRHRGSGLVAHARSNPSRRRSRPQLEQRTTYGNTYIVRISASRWALLVVNAGRVRWTGVRFLGLGGRRRFISTATIGRTLFYYFRDSNHHARRFFGATRLRRACAKTGLQKCRRWVSAGRALTGTVDRAALAAISWCVAILISLFGRAACPRDRLLLFTPV